MTRLAYAVAALALAVGIPFLLWSTRGTSRGSLLMPGAFA